MKIRIIAVGKLKDDFMKIGVNEYLTRIKPYCNIEIVEVKDEKVSDKPNESEIKKIKDIEGERVLKLIKPSDFIINLDMNKKEMDSVVFSSYLMKSLESGNANISFVIGGSYGLSDSLKKRGNDAISLSKMTFLHTMTRLILLEQIYRAFKIESNETYHK